MPEKFATVIGAITLAAFHFAVAVFPLLRWSGNGEWYSFWDVPLEALLRRSKPLTDFIMHGSSTRYILFISIGGTILYGAVGALVGYALDWTFDRVTRRHAD